MFTESKYFDRTNAIVRVLAIEDNPGDLGLVKEMLDDAKMGKYQLQHVNRLSSAIKMLRTEDFDVILLDLNLLDSNGFDTFLSIHNRFPEIPIIVLTGSTDEEPSLRAINEGAQDYLFKDVLTSRSLSHAILHAIERKRVEEILHQTIQKMEESHRTLKAIMENVPEGITITDGPPDFLTKTISLYTLRTTGRPLEMLVGVPTGMHQDAWGFILPDGTIPEAEQTPLYRAARYGEESKNVEFILQTADGRKLTVIDSAAPIRDREGNVVAAINVWRDISGIKETENELEEEKSRAELYLDLLTHDIGNYNAAAMGYLQLAEETLKLEGRDKKLIAAPLQELRNSTELIANIRDIQLLDTKREKNILVDICQMLEEIIDEHGHPLDREVVISFNDEDRCSVMASGLLRDAFSNIIGNAIKHSSGPLEVGVTLSSESQDGRSYARVSIEDNGPGITAEIKERLFARSMRGLTKSAGHGLGLYLVKRLVEGLDGKVWAEDRVPGDHTKGAKFVVLLPTA